MKTAMDRDRLVHTVGFACGSMRVLRAKQSTRETACVGEERSRWRPTAAQTKTWLFADDAILVRVPHVLVCRVRIRNRGNPVPASLGAGDQAVAVVVVPRECIVAAATITDTGRGRRSDEHDGLERSALATSENPVERVRFTTIDGETVGATDSDDASCEPATILGRDPLGGILAALLVAVHGRRSEREVAKVAGKAGLGPCNPRAQSPESWASLAATMCSMSVSAADAKQVPVYGP